MNNLSGYLTMNQPGSQSPNLNEIINPIQISYNDMQQSKDEIQLIREASVREAKSKFGAIGFNKPMIPGRSSGY